MTAVIQAENITESEILSGQNRPSRMKQQRWIRKMALSHELPFFKKKSSTMEGEAPAPYAPSSGRYGEVLSVSWEGWKRTLRHKNSRLKKYRWCSISKWQQNPEEWKTERVIAYWNTQGCNHQTGEAAPVDNRNILPLLQMTREYALNTHVWPPAGTTMKHGASWSPNSPDTDLMGTGGICGKPIHRHPSPHTREPKGPIARVLSRTPQLFFWDHQDLFNEQMVHLCLHGR